MTTEIAREELTMKTALALSNAKQVLREVQPGWSEEMVDTAIRVMFKCGFKAILQISCRGELNEEQFREIVEAVYGKDQTVIRL